VNFLESYLVKNNELWVIMEYMEGGALTDIIENNALEISSISLEVCPVLVCDLWRNVWILMGYGYRRVKFWVICIYRDIKSVNVLLDALVSKSVGPL
jgi:protein-serine/threonine kinase